jgi:polyisoprenoid-binding protein YceI
MKCVASAERCSARVFWAWLLAILTAALVACAPRIAVQTSAAPAQTPADFPEAYYRQLETRGSEVLRVDSSHSLVTIEVHRAGVLARLGHDHVVASHDVRGYVAPAEGRSDIYVQLDRLTVDEPDLRTQAGFNTQPSQEAIDGTRSNMLTKVLEAKHFPFAVIRVSRGADAESTLNVAITLRGTTRTMTVPAEISSDPRRVNVSGELSFKQSDFGIVPLSILGGALQVQDRLDLRFRILANNS